MTDRAQSPAGLPFCGVVVTYHPGPDLEANVRAMVRECGAVAVVDNGSAPESVAGLRNIPGVTLLEQGENVGVAAALNRGAAWARDSGYTWCVAFDQDSVPEPGMVAALWTTHLRLPRAAIIGPRVLEQAADPDGYRWVVRHPGCRWLFRRVACKGQDLPEVTMLITSGSLFSLEGWSRAGGFDEGLFIDYVDVDFCLRTLRAGGTIAVSAGAALNHRLGDRRAIEVFGKRVRPMGHAPFRHYYMMRNRCAMWRRHARAVPHWAMFDLAFGFFNTARVFAFEKDRLAKLRMMGRGLWHGFRGKSGPLR